MQNETDPLDALSVQADRMDEEKRARLAQLIMPYVRIDFDKGKIFLLQESGRLSAKQKVLLCLLAQLALTTKTPTFPPELSGNEIQQISGLPGGTVRPKLSELITDKIVMKADKGYAVSFVAIPNAELAMQNKSE